VTFFAAGVQVLECIFHHDVATTVVSPSLMNSVGSSVLIQLWCTAAANFGIVAALNNLRYTCGGGLETSFLKTFPVIVMAVGQ
jgi:hypothetical protein